MILYTKKDPKEPPQHTHTQFITMNKYIQYG